MQEDKFENQVQKIMDQLSFEPADGVWTGVAKGIEEDKKRRKPFFWILFIGGPILIGAGYLFLAGSKPGNTHTTVSLPIKDSIQLSPAKNNTIAKNDAAETGVNKSYLFLGQPVEKINKHEAKIYRNTGKYETSVIPSNKISGTNESSEKILSENMGNAVVAEKTVTTGITAVQNDAVTGLPADSPVVAAIKPSVQAANADSSSIVKSIAKKDKKTAVWNFGITGMIGYSGIQQPPSQDKALNFPTTGGTPTTEPSKPEGGFSFSTGVFVSRVLSKRVSVSAGLNYHYYSSKTIIGNQVSNTGTNYIAYLSNTAVSYYTNTNTNSGSHSYTSQFQFIELPILADLTLNKSKKFPLVWEAGISFAYLISADYLYFDPNANVYYKNTGMYNRSQWNASTALMIGWNIHNSRLLAGPQLQYGLSSLLNASASYTQHLYGYGLKITFIPGGK